MIINKIFPGIIEIENFISEEELIYLQNLCSSITEEQWSEYSKDSVTWKDKIYFSKPVQIYLDKINERLKLLFQSYSKVWPLHTIHRVREDEILDYHSDNGASHERTHHIVYGVVLYINDNFEGGELDYWGINLSYKPRAGALVIHYGGLRHGIKPVVNGTRYMITSFIEGDESSPALFISEIGDQL